MPRIRHVGYDKALIYTEPELIHMFRAEGLSEEQAIARAKQLHTELNTLAENEAYSWKNIRQNEITSGLEPDVMEDVV